MDLSLKVGRVACLVPWQLRRMKPLHEICESMNLEFQDDSISVGGTFQILNTHAFQHEHIK